MSLQQELVAQFRQPTGALGRLAGWTMAHRPSNRQRNACTIELLELAPDDDVLEIGYGPGVAIEQASREIVDGRILGFDHSKVMHEQASRRNANA
ncbi:MAG: class I SAM-dependent methyltransferase, partial [Gammaproteobacteria bacterium]|nr:class I SAM-dependent methyltransferase [Gammaproteobacteria bacterium]